MILNFTTWLRNRRGAPIVNETVPATPANHGNKSLATFIREEVGNYQPDLVFADSDIASVRSSSGRNHTRILSLPMTAFLSSIQDESPKSLDVVIDTTIAQEPPTNPSVDAFAHMMHKSKPTKHQYKSKWQLDDIITFQSGYETAVNKALYLTSLPKDKKPSIDDQIEAFVVDFMNDNDIGFKGGTGGEEDRAEDAKKQLMNVVKFVHDHRVPLSRSRLLLWGTSRLLVAVHGCVSSKEKPGKMVPLSKEMATDWIEKTNQCAGAFPKSYYRKVGNGSQYGAPIFSELDIMRNLLGQHHAYLLMQDVRNRNSVNRTEANAPTQFNTSCEVIPATA